MHTYEESWQVAPFRNPVEGEFVLQDHKNGWMRVVAYKYLFIIQGAGLVMANHGYNGFETVGISLALKLWSYVGDGTRAKRPRLKSTTSQYFPCPLLPFHFFCGASSSTFWRQSLVWRDTLVTIH